MSTYMFYQQEPALSFFYLCLQFLDPLSILISPLSSISAHPCTLLAKDDDSGIPHTRTNALTYIHVYLHYAIRPKMGCKQKNISDTISSRVSRTSMLAASKHSLRSLAATPSGLSY